MKSASLLTVLFSLATLSAASPASAVELAVTVDDLPLHGDLTPDMSRLDVAKLMLAAFKKYKVPEVYGFVNSHTVDGYPKSMEVLKEWVAQGYPVGNHTSTHMDLHKVSADEFITDIASDESLLSSLMPNSDAWKMFRYPYLDEGDTQDKRDKVRSYLASKNYKIAQVTTDFSDWSWNAPYSRCYLKDDAASVKYLQDSYLQSAKDALAYSTKIGKLMFRRDIRQILILHIGTFDALMADPLLDTLQKQGVKFVSLTTALQDPAYAQNPNIVTTDGLNFLEQIKLSHEVQGFPAPTYPLDKLNTLCN